MPPSDQFANFAIQKSFLNHLDKSMSYVKKEGAKKRKVDANAGLSVDDMKDMYSLEEDGLEIVEMDVSEEEEKKKEDEVRKISVTRNTRLIHHS